MKDFSFVPPRRPICAAVERAVSEIIRTCPSVWLWWQTLFDLHSFRQFHWRMPSAVHL